MPVVVGIFPNHDAITKVTDALKAGGLDINDLTVVSNEELSYDLVSSGVRFVLTGEPEDDLLTTGTGIITTSGGTGVPGLTDSMTQPHVSHERTTAEWLDDLDVPDGRSDDYTEALEHGRCIAGYVTSNDIDKVKTLFAGAGGNPVEVF